MLVAWELGQCWPPFCQQSPVRSLRPRTTYGRGTYNPTSSDLDVSGVEYDVPYLAEEDIGASELEIASIGVSISLDQAQGAGAEVGRPFDHGHVGGIPNELCVVVVYDGARDLVCSSWQVYHCWSDCRANTWRVTAAPIAILNGTINGSCVVRDYEVALAFSVS